MATKEGKQEVKVRKCLDCGGQMHGTRTYYHYTECGLDSVVIENIIVYRCSCGAIVPEIPAIGELHRAIVLHVIRKQTILSGQEIRFLRKMAGLSSKELAIALGANASSLSRWENGTRKISKRSDAALRLICITGMLQEVLRDRDLVPTVAEASRQLSQVDIMNILTSIVDEASGPVSMSIDPQELAKFGEHELSESGKSVVM